MAAAGWARPSPPERAPTNREPPGELLTRLELVLRLPHEHQSVPVARHIIRAAMHTLGVTATCVHDIEVTLSEACTNVLAHDGSAQDYEVGLDLHDDRCMVRVIDVGRGLDPAAAGAWRTAEPSQTGQPSTARGLLLMRALVDRMGFSVGVQAGTVVSLEKRLLYVQAD